jgi:hypothetical protein
VPKFWLGIFIIAISGVGAWFGWHLASEGWKNWNPQRDKLSQKEETEYRKELIKQWRDGIESVDVSKWHDAVGYGDEPWYSSLRQYMKKETIEKLERPRTFIVPGGRGRFPRKQILLDEIAKIEKKWGLTRITK